MIFGVPVHNGTAHQSKTEECWTGVLEHLDSPVVNHQQYCHHAGDRTEQRHRQQHQPKVIFKSLNKVIVAI